MPQCETLGMGCCGVCTCRAGEGLAGAATPYSDLLSPCQWEEVAAEFAKQVRASVQPVGCTRLLSVGGCCRRPLCRAGRAGV